MTASHPPGDDSKRWLIWLALGVILALIGPTWLFNWKFNPATQEPEPTPPPHEEPENASPSANPE